MTPEQQKALEALQALHAENERLGLYKDAYAQSTTTQTQVRSTEEALKLALEALEPLIVERTCEAMEAGEKAITAIKEALAQPDNQGKIQTVDSSTERKAD